MENIKLLIDTCIDFFNTKLTFSPFSFTIMQALVGCVCLAIIINFISRLFDI